MTQLCYFQRPQLKRAHSRLNLRSTAVSPSSLPPTTGGAQKSILLFSPSKVNLFLRILRKREDGFHNLASLFHVIDFGDTLEVSAFRGAAKDSLSCNVKDVPIDGSNLVNKAFQLFRKHTGLDTSFQAHLQKSVPAGAGLGGGSGNAATALWAANELTGRPASNADLLKWSGEIGSDISIFFSEGAAYCTGRGEIVESVAPPLPLGTPLLLVKPSMGLLTSAIFKAFDLSLASTADPRALMSRLCSSGMRQDVCINDLERPAFINLPELAELKERLTHESDGSFSAVFMSGSGSTIVCFGSHQVPAFLSEPQYSDVLVQPARLMAREAGCWYNAGE
ncbi:hypothetical protein WJX73_009527 [Symbiochloris irregularis]|uniref:4-(cytidine 5'-diphospho)-2-C-methyl-D-erythritol kinase n=1 Tax=Symbiochloris irregularis TaxID=706552 RepID=A0AAW1NZF5_9CHLO